MAVTTESSTEAAAIAAGTIGDLAKDATLRSREFNFTQGAAAGDANSTMRLVQVPAGKVRLHLAECRLHRSAFGAARVLDVGFEAYTKPDGTAVAANLAAFVNDLDVSAAGAGALTGVVGTSEIYELESREGVWITAQVAGGTIPAAATLKGKIAFTHR